MQKKSFSRREFVKLTGSLGLTTFGIPPLLTMFGGCSTINSSSPTSSQIKPSRLSKEAPPTPPTWGLWSVRRSDLQDVYCAGFDGVRPPYPDSSTGNPNDQYDNYATTHEYALVAQSIGFKKLIFDAGLRWLYMTTGGDVGAMNAEITNHFNQIRNSLGSNPTLICYPYFDEPDLLGRRADPGIGIQGCHDDTWDPVNGYDYEREYNPDFGNILNECLDVQKANQVVQHAAAEANRILGTHLIIATLPLDSVCPENKKLQKT
jgi:hypothetical protein